MCVCVSDGNALTVILGKAHQVAPCFFVSLHKRKYSTKTLITWIITRCQPINFSHYLVLLKQYSRNGQKVEFIVIFLSINQLGENVRVLECLCKTRAVSATSHTPGLSKCVCLHTVRLFVIRYRRLRQNALQQTNSE